MSPVESIGLLQRLQVSQQTAWEEWEFLDDLMGKEVKADEKTYMMMDYFTWNWHNRWSLLQWLSTEGELEIMLSLRAVSWLIQLEYEGNEAF